MCFKRKKRKKQTKEEALYKEWIFSRLDSRKVKYVSLRKGIGNGETILGKDGFINVIDGKEIAIVCNNKIVFRKEIEKLKVDELMSLSGVNFRYKDEVTLENITITAYYKYHRK